MGSGLEFAIGDHVCRPALSRGQDGAAGRAPVKRVTGADAIGHVTVW